MSLNGDQLDYVRELSQIPPAEKCWCAWFKLGECPHCPPGRSAADRIKVECPSCGNYPHTPGSQIVHRIGCRACP